MKILTPVPFFFLSLLLIAQTNEFTCQSPGGEWLSQLVGSWEVTTKDRTSPGNYQSNAGRSLITPLIDGCGIKESFRGTFRDNNYGREVSIFAVDSVTVAMTALDSEHGSFSNFEGTIDGNQMTVLWYRNKEVGRLRSKYMLTIENSDSFEFSSFLSTDHGETWALTHERKYQKTISNYPEEALSKYHEGFSNGNFQLIRNSISNQLNMINGNFSSDPSKWQAHQFLSGNDINKWIDMMLANAGPFENSFQVKSQNTHNNSAVIVTTETGRNKFRSWENEEVVYYLGKVNDSWKITGFFIKNISNPD